MRIDLRALFTGKAAPLQLEYTSDQAKACAYMAKIAPNLGCGDDPVGFLIASHATMRQQRDDALYEMELARMKLRTLEQRLLRQA